jgi:hypothetical protein
MSLDDESRFTELPIQGNEAFVHGGYRVVSRLPGPRIPLPTVRSAVTGRFPAGLSESKRAEIIERERQEAIEPIEDHFSGFENPVPTFTGRVVLKQDIEKPDDEEEFLQGEYTNLD